MNAGSAQAVQLPIAAASTLSYVFLRPEVIEWPLAGAIAAGNLPTMRAQLIRPIGAEGLNRRPPAGSCRLFLGPGYRLAARWNRLVETVKTRKQREKTGEKWARYSLKRVKEGS